MRSSRIISLVAAVSALAAERAAAQPYVPPPYWFGFNASIDYSLHRSFTPKPYGNAPEPVDGDGTGFTAGVMGGMTLGGDQDGTALLLHLGYGSLPASFTSKSSTENGLGPHDEPLRVEGTHEADISLGLVKSDLQLRLPIVEWRDWDRKRILYFNIGPSVGYVVDGTWAQAFFLDDTTWTLRLTPDDNYGPAPAGRDMFVYEEAIRHAERWRFGIRAGLAIGIWSRSFYLSPTLSVDYALTPVVKGSSWKAHAIQLGIDLQTYRSFWNWLLGDPYEGGAPLGGE